MGVPALKRLTKTQARTLADKIKAHLDGARELILELHEGEGWVALGYGSWRECVIAEFDQSQAHLYRQLEAAKIEREISPIGEKLGQIPEGQLRPLKALPAGQRKEAWDDAKASAANGKVTTKHVEQAVDQRVGKSKVNGVLVHDPPDIAEKRANGKIAPDVLPDITEPGREPGDDEDDEPQAPEPLSDDEWLESLPVRPSLSANRRKAFDADALDYRRLESARKTFQQHASRALKATGEYAYRTKRYLKTDHPKHWLICPAAEHGGCGGSGEIPLTGRCPKCRGRGYYIR